jgi:hypothetical protein
MMKHRFRATLWQRALAEDSNLALDWLWLYTQVESDEQRQFCLQKVRTITGQARWHEQIVHITWAQASKRARTCACMASC